MKTPGFNINISIGIDPGMMTPAPVDLKPAARDLLKNKVAPKRLTAPVGKKVVNPPFDVNEDPYPKLTQSKNEPSPGPGMKEKPKRGYYY